MTTTLSTFSQNAAEFIPFKEYPGSYEYRPEQ